MIKNVHLSSGLLRAEDIVQKAIEQTLHLARLFGDFARFRFQSVGNALEVDIVVVVHFGERAWRSEMCLFARRETDLWAHNL